MKVRKIPFILSATACFILWGVSYPAFAGEQGLYPAAPPPGSAFVRFLNGSSPMALPIRMRGKSYGAIALGGISPYAAVPQGGADVTIGTQSATSKLKEGAYYTVILARGHISMLKEPANDNKLKAQIILINVSGIPNVSLKTTDGSMNIVDPVGDAKLGARAVNTVKVPLSVYAAENKIEDLNAHLLERGERYAVVVYNGPNGKPIATFN